MQKRILSIAIILFSLYLLNTGCSKLDTTDIGSDLLPAVDNVHTFDTLITINTTQGVFDDTLTTVTSSDDHVVGRITNDPLFGSTQASLFAQFKPTFYPYYYGNTDDSIIGFDSVVLCLTYKGFWGDSITPMQLEVKEVSPAAGGLWDSVYQSRNVTFAPPVGNVLGSKLVDFTTIGNYFTYANKRDSVRNQVRIKLTNSSFLNALYTRDTLPLGNNSFRSDSLFKVFQKGFAVTALSGKGLFYTNLADTFSKLEIHYRKKIKSTGVIDTSYSSFKLNTSQYTSAGSPSATANNIVRGRSGFPVSTPGANDIYLQTSPGTYANLTIPALATLSNRIIHRAEVIIEQVPTDVVTDSTYSTPDFLYMDLVDTSTSGSKWKPVYFDLNPSSFYDPDYKITTFFPTGGIDYFTFGGFRRYKQDLFGKTISFYNFNITRYVQEIVTKHTNNYTLRLFAPYTFSYPQYYPSSLPGGNKLAKGRVRVGSGANANYRMRLRLVYSKI